MKNRLKANLACRPIASPACARKPLHRLRKTASVGPNRVKRTCCRKRSGQYIDYNGQEIGRAAKDLLVDPPKNSGNEVAFSDVIEAGSWILAGIEVIGGGGPADPITDATAAATVRGGRALAAEVRAVERGSRNPVVRDAAAAGRAAHKEWNAGTGFRKEVTLANGKRADAVNFETRHVKELKPDNPRAIARGEKQVEGYRQQLEKQTGDKFTCSVETYCRK